MDWIEISRAPSARADLVSIQVDLARLAKYPLPSKDMEDWQNNISNV